MMYGFRAELERKYGKAGLKPIYAACKRLFAMLPLAARVGSGTLVLHGGLYRKPAAAAPASKVGLLRTHRGSKLLSQVLVLKY